jgi:hypothetical protein
MKNSYFVTPRTLDSCSFMPSMDPISHYPQPHHARFVDKVIVLVCAVALPFVLYLAVWR